MGTLAKIDAAVPIAEHVKTLALALLEACQNKGLKAPKLLLEPGRSIVGDAGITLYKVGRLKHSAGKDYIFVDGGMSDNPRPIMYDAAHHFALACPHPDAAVMHFDIAGKFCESGDILGKNIKLPSPKKGDILFAHDRRHNYAMVSNYNRARKA